MSDTHQQHQSTGLDRLLDDAAAAHRREAVPGELLERVETSLRTRQRHNRSLAAGLGGAAMLVLAVGWFGLHLAGQKQASDPRVNPPVAANATTPAPPPARVEIGVPDDVIVQRIPTKNPNITILWLHPEVKVADGEPASQADPASPKGRTT